MATQTLSHTEADTVVPISTQILSERPAEQRPGEQAEPVPEQAVKASTDSTQSKPKVRRVIDEEGGTSTATVDLYTFRG